jgi:DNA-binding CsgD family transcriptional regulator
MTKTAQAPYDTLLSQIYGAAIDPAVWPSVVAAFAELFNGGAALFSQRVPHSANVYSYAGLDPAVMQSYETYYSCRKPWLSKYEAIGPESVVTLADLIDERSYQKSEYLNDFLERADYYYVLGIMLAKGPAGATCATLVRSRRHGDYTGAEVGICQKLAPHIRRAMDIHDRLHRTQLQRDGLLLALEGLSIGAILVSQDAKILFANGVAEGILRCGDGLRAVQCRLRAADCFAGNQLDALIHAAALTGATKADSHGGVVAIPRKNKTSLSALVCPFPLAHAPLGMAVPVALIFLSTSGDSRSVTAADLRCLYGFTPAEARLAAALLTGKTLIEYSEIAGITLPTAKTQLQNIFSKTGQSGQSGLMRYILSDLVIHFHKP